MRVMRETTRRNRMHRAVVKGITEATADLHKILDRRYKVLKRELRRANLRKRLSKSNGLFKAEPDTWVDWINQFPLNAKSALNHIVYGVYDTEGQYWQSRGQQLDPLDPDAIFAAYEARTGRQIKDIAENTKSDVLTTITDWYNSDKSLPELIDQLGQFFSESRAETIARTEAQYIVSQIALESMKQFGIKQFNVDLALEPGPCPQGVCPEQADANPHDVGDEMPPYHPNCQCHIVYVMPEAA